MCFESDFDISQLVLLVPNDHINVARRIPVDLKGNCSQSCIHVFDGVLQTTFMSNSYELTLTTKGQSVVLKCFKRHISYNKLL